ncbi:MAG TPA: fatty acid desaturase [Sandaracinaceae bacterium LLY-WYZ-13_1]|nr:fatty acid desaturase [Sandaracinaceae bacterium LLY-WYZ-13_1]
MTAPHVEARPTAPEPPRAPREGVEPDEAERLKRFGQALDELRRCVQREIGEEDLRHIRRVDRVSRAAEVLGRALIHFSVEPVGFAAGVGSLWIHKQLQATEIGHTVLHGAFDRIEGADRYRSKGFRWQIPIDEASWDRGHNKRHHGMTNVAGGDPDIHFGPVRLTEHTPHHWYHRLQLPFTLLLAWPNFALAMNLHFTGMLDLYQGNGRDEHDFIRRRDLPTAIDCHRRALRKLVPYYLREYVFFPALAGPFFWKVLLGNWLSETMRDVYSAATIYCGHVGEDTARYPEGTRPSGRGHWYAMQVEASNDFEVPWAVSVLCGALDRQIEHHLFPRFPTERLRQVAPEVRAICEAHGVEYRTDTWPRTLGRALRRIAKLGRPEPRAA